ncbi:auxilin-like protein 1 isoform X2 [Tripterygium wilfordii]|uniref:auxilin-like protein 1 isoform X2 n=1 Tax=Tripterygium wilfordii TaxID=458696 RepID=UPI0018F83608|nr:auxilin-like protein 1 isoform X2 [Tripterygium wilfordii]
MDEFGVLTERFGLKPQGKSAPMASAKRSATTTTASHNFTSNSSLSSKPDSYSWNSTTVDDFSFDNLEMLSQSSTNLKSQNVGGLGDDFDIFGGFQNSSKPSNANSNGSSFDYDSIFSNSNSSRPSSTNLYKDDDIFGGLSSSNSINGDDVFSSFSSVRKQNVPVDDLLGGLGAAETNTNRPSHNGGTDVDDLIPGFGGRRPQSSGAKTATTKTTFASPQDPFVIFEKTSASTHKSSDADPLEQFNNLNQSAGSKPLRSSNGSPPLRPPPKPGQVLKTGKVRSSVVSSIDELEDFARGTARNKPVAEGIRERPSSKASKYREAEDATKATQQKGVDLESFFGMGSRSSSVPRPRATNLDPIFDSNTNVKGGPKVTQRSSSGPSSNTKKTSSAVNLVDDISSLFGAARVSGEFEEVEGESEERRRARLERHLRTQDRVEKAVADINQRDLQTQLEQEEKRRIADAMDAEIKRWAAGKEGNMRALLSSLQLVLWPECGWEPVSLTDLITSTSVKKVYRKAALYVHPDKVQQKGATLQQKYIAEKVFDILKEAWNKFSSEELS